MATDIYKAKGWPSDTSWWNSEEGVLTTTKRYMLQIWHDQVYNLVPSKAKFLSKQFFWSEGLKNYFLKNLLYLSYNLVMGSQVYALAQLGFPFPKSSIEVQHILALGIWGLGIAKGNAKLDSAYYFAKNM